MYFKLVLPYSERNCLWDEGPPYHKDNFPTFKLMKSIILAITILIAGSLSCQSQTPKSAPGSMSASADQFLQSLNPAQKAKAHFSFEDSERYNWHYIPKQRNGIMLKELNGDQLKKAMALLHTGLSDTGYNKATSIMQLENVLKEVESRPAGDEYRDQENLIGKGIQDFA